MTEQIIGRWRFDRPDWNGGIIYLAEAGDWVMSQPDHEGDVELEISESGYYGSHARVCIPIELMRQLVVDYDAAQTEKAAKPNEGSGG